MEDKKMTVQDLYEYITKHMTAEQALMNLLKGHVIEYEKLKFSAEGEEIHPIMLITMAAMDMGWDMAVPDPEDPDAEVIGMIVGTTDYIDDVLGKYDDKLDHDEN
jgi:hypothetical protein